MSLKEYKQKRHFKKTSEPAGQTARKSGWSFVVQKHQASHLHYDFRLELDGVLKSWAVPKGPCLDPSVKRLAMHVEDHPVEYGAFEGIIPEGEYGGGTVMVWDSGHWEPVGVADAGYQAGRLKFQLFGEKLKGGWMLIRTARRGEKDDRHWLLFKEQDDEAIPLSQGDVLTKKTRSASTGRSMAQIAANANRIWKSTAKSNGEKSQSKKSPVKKKMSRSQQPRSRMPAMVKVQLATLTDEAPSGKEWLHEIKYDGYRMICLIDNGSVRFLSRNQQDWSDRLPHLVEEAENLPASQAILDGEVVAVRRDGTTDFQRLQNAFRDGRSTDLQYYAFDFLYLNGNNIAEQPLIERKDLLAELLGNSKSLKSIHLSEHIEVDGKAFFLKASEKGLEGIISKRRDGPYSAGRSLDWLKVKCLKKEEFVIGGFTEPGGARTGFGALLVGYHDQQNHLRYAGKVGTGFDARLLKVLHQRMQSMEIQRSPFSDFAKGSEKIHWISPILVGQIKFSSWTRDRLLRHPSFQGLREDKPAREVTRDEAISTAIVASTTKSPGAGMSKLKTSPSRNVPVKPDSNYDLNNEEYVGVRLTHPEKILYPEEGITKLELAHYYRAAAEWILPHIKDRPLVLVRCPEGQGQECFYQKHPARGTPENLRRISIKEKSQTGDYVLIDDVNGLISLAQIGALEIHAWGSREDRLEYPDRLIFDLDPDPSVSWNRVVQSALQVRKFLQELGLESYLKTTGGKGLHLVVPTERRAAWDDAKEFCKRVADAIVQADPKNYTANMSKAARGGKIFLDYLRNGRGATAVVPYSPRAKPTAPVSVPLAWSELSAKIHSDQFTIRNIAKRFASLKRDPWEGIATLRQSLAQAQKALKMLGTS